MTDLAARANEPMDVALDKRAEARIQRRVVLPLAVFFVAANFLNAIDRSNISFAAVHMDHDLGFSAQIFGIGVGWFFVSYMMFQFPAVWLSRWLGEPKSIGFIMLSWACAAIAMSLVRDRYSFYGLRFLLGLTEAGATPVMLSYASRWVPQSAQGAFLKISSMSWPLSAVFGAPIASLLMTHTAGFAGLAGWRWLFIAEGLPTIGLGVLALWWLLDDPAQARGLTEQERAWYIARLESDRARARALAEAAQAGAPDNLFKDRRLWLLAVAYFGEIAGLYGCIFWLPQVIDRLSSTIGPDRAVLLTMVPFAFGTLALLANAASSDRRQERSWHTALGFLTGAVGLATAGLVVNPWLGFVALTVGISGLCAGLGLFWSFPTGFFRGSRQAAAGFTIINLVGNLAGVSIPPVIGAMRVATGSFGGGLILLGALLLVTAILIRLVGEPGGAAKAAAVGRTLTP